ncbi:DUF3107 domain-containing protein [Acrocarpospora macrocephala]|uniref:ATP-binding protein n=1 Tax=Acrocarpospora macrocephala TaxID=150177 RepID=A0A5M3X1H8_9ACTN|nr:DUF3107 domain-containing protein [Acrocarpospora macrocephala]GES14536.1 hypothetical protein Amac_081330 [Acrocarpospora macrocephala]
MEIKIGVRSVHREIVLETDESVERIEEELRNALAADRGVFSITDVKGNRYIVPVAALGFVEIGEGENRSVGFGGTL